MRLPNWVGDVVMATPALRCLRLNFPKARIDLTLVPYVREIVQGAPWFDNIIEYAPKGGGWMRFTYDYVNQLRKNQYDLAVVFPNSFSSALLAFLSGAKHRVGYNRQGRTILLTDPVAPLTEKGKFVPQPMVEYYLRLCEALGATTGSRKTELFVDEASERRGEELFEKYRLRREKKVIAIAPGAAFGSSKLWTPEGFGKVADDLADRGDCDIIIVGGPGEKQIAREITRAARSQPVNLVEENMTLSLLKSIAKRCDLFVTVDSGPRHFAVAFDKPVVVLMGATDPRYTNCNLEKTEIVTASGVDCAPCQLKKCPKDRECMTRITPEMVLGAAAGLLEKYV